MKSVSKFGAMALVLLYFLNIGSVQGGRVLFIMSLASKSHRNVFEPLIQELAERDHEVVAVSPFPGKNSKAREISTASETMSDLLRHFKNPVEIRAEGKWAQMNMSPDKFIAACRSTYELNEFMALLNEPRFDIVFVDTILNDCMLGFVYRLGAPLVQWTTFAAGNYITSTVGNRLPPSYVPTPFFNIQHSMTFFVGGAKDGLVLFSLGSIIQGNQVPDKTRKAFLNAFAKLKQRVLWKWETEQMPETLPPNIKLTEWVPQQDVLGHPNTKLFISHVGLLSMQESVYHAKPIIMVPIFGDQDTNAAKAESMVIAKVVEILDVTDDSLVEVIKQVLNDPKYTEKAQELSTYYRDQPETPLLLLFCHLLGRVRNAS